MSDLFLWYAIAIFLALALDMAYKAKRMPHTRVAKTTNVGYPPVTPGPNINPRCPDCNSWLSDHPDKYVCNKCGHETDDVRRKTRNIPGTKIEEPYGEL